MYGVGDQVVCVDARKIHTDTSTVCPQFPIKGEVYTIRALVTNAPSGQLGVYLEELVNPIPSPPEEPIEPSFYGWRFRRVKKTNIDVFLAMLTPKPVKENV
jgi:hypothetical protein